MSDTQAAMREFRFLDDKRKTNGLTPTEEQRWRELASSLGVDLSAQQQPQGYFGEDGQWYAYPAGYDANAPAYGYPGYGYPPPPHGYYGPDGQWYPYPPGFDPTAAAYGYPGYGGYPPPGVWAPPGYEPAQWAAWQAQHHQQGYPQGDWAQQPPPAPHGWSAPPAAAWPQSPHGPPPSAPTGEPALPPPAPVPEPAPAEATSSLRGSDSVPDAPSDEVMEVSDEEVVEIPAVTVPPAPVSPMLAPAPAPLQPPTSADEVADLRNALSMDDDLDFGSDLSSQPSPPVASPVPHAKAPPAAPAPASPSVTAPLPPKAPEAPSLPRVPIEASRVNATAPIAEAASAPADLSETARTDETEDFDVPTVDATTSVLSSTSTITQLEVAAASAISDEGTAPKIPELELPREEAPALSATAVEATLRAVVAEPVPALEKPLEASLDVDIATEPQASPPPSAPPVVVAELKPLASSPTGTGEIGVEEPPIEVAVEAAKHEPPSTAAPEPRAFTPIATTTQPGILLTEVVTDAEPAPAQAKPAPTAAGGDFVPALDDVPVVEAEAPAAPPAPGFIPSLDDLPLIEATGPELGLEPDVAPTQHELPALSGQPEALPLETSVGTAAPGSLAPSVPVPQEEPALPSAAAFSDPAPIATAPPPADRAPASGPPSGDTPSQAVFSHPSPTPQEDVSATPSTLAPTPVTSAPLRSDMAPSPLASRADAPLSARAPFASPEEAPVSAPPPPTRAAQAPRSEGTPSPVTAGALAPSAAPMADAAPSGSALGGLALGPEDAPLPAQASDRDALFASSWDDQPEPEPAPRDTSNFGSWDDVPEADLPEASDDAPVVIASNWEPPAAPAPAAAAKTEVLASNWDAPAAATSDVSVPDEWSEAPAARALPNPADAVPMAQTSEFIPWEQAPLVGAEEALSPAEPGDFVVESASAAELANDFRASAPSNVDGGKLELASIADFLQAPQLAQTGEAWQSDGRAVALDEDVEFEGEIIQGTVVEDEPSPDAADSWSTAVGQPSTPSLSSVSVPPLAPAHVPAPAPAPVAPPPPAASAHVAVPPLGAQPPLQTRVATPIAATPPAPIPPVTPNSASTPVAPAPATAAAAVQASAVPAASTPSGTAMFDPTRPVLSGESVPVRVTGEHRVILHTLEGQVKRGAIRDADLCGPSLILELPAGGSETIARERIKALFFMLNPGSRPPPADGAKVRVTFKDGRQVAGFSRDHHLPQAGFFVVPADNRTNTARIFIYRHGLQTVVPE